MSVRPNREDLVAAFGPLADEKPGARYTSAELLPIYNAWAEQNGLPALLKPKTLGEQIRREVTLDSQRVRGSNRWVLTRAGLECRNWHR